VWPRRRKRAAGGQQTTKIMKKGTIELQTREKVNLHKFVATGTSGKTKRGEVQREKLGGKRVGTWGSMDTHGAWQGTKLEKKK